jgi:hypothetical protein
MVNLKTSNSTSITSRWCKDYLPKLSIVVTGQYSLWLMKTICSKSLERSRRGLLPRRFKKKYRRLHWLSNKFSICFSKVIKNRMVPSKMMNQWCGNSNKSSTSWTFNLWIKKGGVTFNSALRRMWQRLTRVNSINGYKSTRVALQQTPTRSWSEWLKGLKGWRLSLFLMSQRSHLRPSIGPSTLTILRMLALNFNLVKLCT